MSTRTFDPSTFAVIGEGLAAGVSHFSLSEDVQPWSFPALVAQQIGIAFHQPVIQAPGLGNTHFRQMPVIVPDLLQTTVRQDFPGDGAALNNFSVPGFTVRDALEARPCLPLVHRDDARQTLINFILGLPGLTKAEADLPTQVEAVCRRKPSLVLIELGFHELLESCIQGYLHAGERMDLETFEQDYDRLLGLLAESGATLIAASVPNPLHTAYFSSIETAAKILKTEPGFLRKQFDLAGDDRLTLPGLVDIGYQFTARQITGRVPEGSILTAAEAAKIESATAWINAAAGRVAERHGARVYDLHGFLERVARKGIEVGKRRLSADFLDGFYLLNGVYPGRTGHALIANDLLTFINARYGRSYARCDVAEIMAEDGNTLAELAPGPSYTDEFLVPRTRAELPALPPPDPTMINMFPPYDPEKINIFPIRSIYPEFDASGRKCHCIPAEGMPAGGFSEPRLDKPLVLPEGREQTLKLNKAGSYFGDALRPVEAPDDKPFLPAFPPFGASGNTLFGGLAMTDSHVTGEVKIRFSEPNEQNVTRFEIFHPGGLVGDDGVLAAPLFFKLPSQLNTVLDVPGLVSSGELNLDTGVVQNLHYNVLFLNTPILTLFGVNPNLPGVPMLFPGPPNAGSTWARFDQRDDGKLDITLSANMFLPLGLDAKGSPIRFPLPFSTPDLKCASVAARCTTLHPHLHFTTVEDLGPANDQVPDIPVNTVVEYTNFVRCTTFGDVFGLHIDELGGEGTGRCHLMGRLRVQFGPRFGNSVGIAVAFLPPGGLCSEDPEIMEYLPPGVSRGMPGFSEILRFPSGVTYNQRNLSCAADPNRIALGAVDLDTGRVIGEFLHPGFVCQPLFVNLLDVECCTPTDAFNYQGEARFEKGADGQTVLRFNGEVLVPYPRGFKFPAPTADGRPAYTVSRESRLDPFLRLQAMHGGAPARGLVKGGENKVRSSIGQEFSYSFSIPTDPKQPGAAFEYTNHTEDASFKLVSLSWLSATNSLRSESAAGQADTITFSGFGQWSEDEDLHQVSVQISTAKHAPYVGIQIDGGRTSNVNTKPADIRDSMP